MAEKKRPVICWLTGQEAESEAIRLGPTASFEASTVLFTPRIEISSLEADFRFLEGWSRLVGVGGERTGLFQAD